MAGFVRATAGISFNGTGSSINSASGGGQVGDVRYIFAAAATNALTITAGSGWNQLYNAAVSGGVMALWWKPLVSGEVGVNVNLNTNGDAVVIVVSVAAADTAGTPQSTTNSGSGTTLTASSLTPTVANDVELAFFSTQVTTNATTATLSTPTGMSTSNTYNPSSTSGFVGMVGYRTLTGTTATGTSTSTSSQTGTWCTATAVHPPGPVVTGSTPGGFLTFFGGGS